MSDVDRQPVPSLLPSDGRRLALVTGGAGFIGSWMVRALLNRGYKVRVLDDFSTGNSRNLPSTPLLDVQIGDVANSDAVERAAQDTHLVVHLAGLVGVRLVHSQAERAYYVAVEGARNVLNIVRGPIVFASSSAVYGVARLAQVSEEDPIDEQSVRSYDGGASGYALGKWHAESLAQKANARGKNVLIARFFNVVGQHQDDRYGMVLPNFLKRAVLGEPLVIYGDGSQTRCFSDVRTTCDLVLRLAEKPGTGIFNIGTSEQVSILELANLVIEETGSLSVIKFVPYQHVFPGRHDVLWRMPNNARATAAVGPTAWPNIRTILRHTLSSVMA